jgi:hypothetical protein
MVTHVDTAIVDRCEKSAATQTTMDLKPPGHDEYEASILSGSDKLASACGSIKLPHRHE